LSMYEYLLFVLSACFSDGVCGVINLLLGDLFSERAHVGIVILFNSS